MLSIDSQCSEGVDFSNSNNISFIDPPSPYRRSSIATVALELSQSLSDRMAITAFSGEKRKCALLLCLDLC